MSVTALPIQISFIQSNYNSIVLANHTTSAEKVISETTVGIRPICTLHLRLSENAGITHPETALYFHFICSIFINLRLSLYRLLTCRVSQQFIRHMKSSPNVSKTPIPPMDFMSSTLGSDLGATLLSEEDEDEEERYAMVSKNLCGFEYIPGHSVENLDGSGTVCLTCGETDFLENRCFMNK